MVARITTGKSFRGLIYYNEHKVKDGQATCIQAAGFGMEASELTPKQKLTRFQKRAQLRDDVKTNVVHISLNFAPGEELDNDKLQAIAACYMEKLGYGDQPYLLYKHRDAAHPHVHIVTTNIHVTGERLPTHKIGEGIGMVAREAVEEEFGLIKASGRQTEYYQDIAPARLEQAEYGKSQNKAAISNVVRQVLARYHFTSLQELNAILRPLNVIADPGEDGTQLQERGGLVYSMIDREGERRGVAIKASSIYVNAKEGWPNTATLKMLRLKYKDGQYKRKAYRERVIRIVEGALNKGVTLGDFRAALSAHEIETELRYNINGELSGITFIDHRTGAVFKGSDLRRTLSATGIGARLISEDKKSVAINRGRLRAVLKKTDFSKGFPAVVDFWNGQGLAIQVRHLGEGEHYFFAGDAAQIPSTYLPTPASLTKYLMANLRQKSTPSARTRKERATPPASHRQDAFNYSFTQELPGGSMFTFRDFWEELTTAETTFSYVPAELLRASRKKRKKKRKR